ncbi:THAP domain-containing protein 1 B-like [Montipora foliosa]|uniref:THAP domain-containing protein 1 B-like n=1 Tax=Montipora foliosa TaxID=591990 RepID=UPI0035F13CFD
MPTHCCVPEYTKKGCRDENENQISFFKFPIDDPQLKRKWLHAIRRDERKYYKVTEAIKVCSRHFRPDLADHIPNNSANDDPVEFAESADGSTSFSCSVRDAQMQTELEIGSETELRQQVLEIAT